MFESSERQNKFLRLLGGMKNKDKATPSPGMGKKKGLFGSLLAQKEASSGQTALSYKAAQVMNRRLEADFDRALEFKGQRGVGLGFTPDPAEGKKFHININKSASKNFDV